MKKRICFSVLCAVASISAAAHAQIVAARNSITHSGAKAAISAVMKEAKKLGAPGAAVAVVDEGGNLICVERLDGTFAAASRVSAGKAKTAAMFKKPTGFFEKIIKEGRTPMVALDDFTPLQGGVPIVVSGQVVGAIGVSGAASAQQDEDLAMVGAAAIASQTSEPGGSMEQPVTFIEGKKVASAFQKGEVLIDGEGRNYMVHASRRDQPGMAEVHMLDTDIIHVLDGSATFVTGGTLADPASPSGDDEIRAKSIEGGQTRKLARGDVVVVPSGVPHWFREVESPLTYYVVKVR